MKTCCTFLLLAVPFLAGCASAPFPFAPDAGASWKNECYSSMDEDTRRIAGSDAVDCGLLHLDSDDNTLRQVVACAKEAESRGKSFRVGYSSFGIDSAYCEVAIRAADGQLWKFHYDNDVTGQLGRNGNHSTVWLSRCTGVEFRPGGNRRWGFFSTEGCTSDEKAADKYIWAFHRSAGH